MQAIRAIGAAFLMTWAMLPTTTHAQATSTVAAQASPPAAATCPCPGVQHRHVWRRHRHYYAWHHRHLWPVPVIVEPPPRAYYNVPLPPTFDGAYTDMLTQRARYFWLVANGPVYEYDIMANAYIPLARGDAERVLAAVGIPH